MLTDSALRYADLQACCSCIGFREEDTYKIDSDAEVSIRTILRYLRNESRECDIRRELGRLRIVSSDLVPLLCCCDKNKTLFELNIRLLMNLTQPALVCFRNEIPKDRDLYGAFMQIDDILKSYKKDFANENLFRVLHSMVAAVFDKEWDERGEDDRLLIERILILIRNILHILPDVEERRTDEDVSVHDQILWAMHLAGWDELLLFMGNSDDEHMFVFHTLEIISLMMREQTPENLAAGTTTSQNESQLNERRQILERLKIRQTVEKKQFLIDCNSRNNRFGGTFELGNTRSLTERPLIYHHDITTGLTRSFELGPNSKLDRHQTQMQTDIGLVNLGVDKRVFRKSKIRKPLMDQPLYRRSILAVQMHLQQFCWNFLQFCYNPIMRVARSTLTRQAVQENDETYYLWAMRFFMAFCRLYRFRSDYLSETLNLSTFHWIYDQVMNYREHLITDKRGGCTNQRAVQAARRMELAISAYREFLICLDRMVSCTLSDRLPAPQTDESQESVDDRLRVQALAAESLMANVFYVSEYQEVFPLLLRDYNEIFLSREYLRNLVEGTHLFITLLTKNIECGTKTIVLKRRKVVRQKLRRGKTQKQTAKKKKAESEELPEVRRARLEDQWNCQLGPSIINLLTGANDEPEDDDDMNTSRLFDATASQSEEAQLRSAIRRVQAALFAGLPRLALSLARRMWRLWPEATPLTLDDSNDAAVDVAREAGLPPHDLAIFGALRQIHITELDEDDEESNEASNDEDGGVEEDLYDEELGHSDSNDGALVTTEKEIVTDGNAFLLKFAHSRVIHAFTLLLADYATNPQSTNKALVHIIHKLAVKQRLVGCFFQLRLFHVFQTFLHDRGMASLGEFKELLNLIKYILRKFFEAQVKNNSVLIELLFFKTVKESFELVQGYGTFEENKKTLQWTKEQDRELTQLFEAYRHDSVPRGQDLGDVIMKHFSDPSKTRRQIVARLIVLDLISSSKQLKQITIRPAEPMRRSKSKPSYEHTDWTEEELMRLRTAVDLYRDSKKMLTDVMNELKIDYDLAVVREQDEEADDLIMCENKPPATFCLRPRRIVAAKILELGLVSDASAFGRTYSKKNTGLKPKRRHSSSSDEEPNRATSADEQSDESDIENPTSPKMNSEVSNLDHTELLNENVHNSPLSESNSINIAANGIDDDFDYKPLPLETEFDSQEEDQLPKRFSVDLDLSVSRPGKRKHIICSDDEDDEIVEANSSHINVVNSSSQVDENTADISVKSKPNRRIRLDESSDSE